MSDAPGLFFSSRVRREHRDRTAGDPRAYRVGAAGEDDRYSRSEHQACAVRIREEGELLRENIPGFEVWDEKYVRIPGNGGMDLLCLGSCLADGVVEGKRPVENASGDLPSLGHLAQAGRIDRGGHL